jgi:hypothetical protein
MLPTMVRFIWLGGFRGEYFFKKSTNQKQELPVVAMFVNWSGQNEPCKDAFYQVSVHLAKR